MQEHVAVILTALPVEFLAVTSHLEGISEDTHEHGTIYEVGTFEANGRSWKVAVAQIGKGNNAASFQIERAVATFRPSVAMFVGVAGGIKDVRIGDVVAADEAFGYESGKDSTDFEARPTSGKSSSRLVQRAQKVMRDGLWIKRIPAGTSVTAPASIVSTIVSGEKVLVSLESALYEFIRRTYGQAVAVEMEGKGFLESLHSISGVDGIVVRGISDLLAKKSESDDQGSQESAAQHAAAFAFEMLATFDPTNIAKPTEATRDDDVRHIKDRFDRHTKRVQADVNRSIVGLEASLERPETDLIIDQLNAGSAVMLVGEAGSGKSGIASSIVEHRQQAGGAVLYLDARRLADLPYEASLTDFLELKLPIEEAIEVLGTHGGCLVVVDQLDSSSGLKAESMLAGLLEACAGLEGVDVVAVTRRAEPNEIGRLCRAGFVTTTSRELDDETVLCVLSSLELQPITPELLRVCRNLLNLDLVARIWASDPLLDLTRIHDEVSLWEEFVSAIRQRDSVGNSHVKGDAVVAEAVLLAAQSMSRDDRTCTIEFPETFEQGRLLSWGVIERQSNQVCKFRHEKIQEFLCAWGYCGREESLESVASSIPQYRLGLVLDWMVRIYQKRKSSNRVSFLREVLGV